jgi:predicted Zn-dependent peptidase
MPRLSHAQGTLLALALLYAGPATAQSPDGLALPMEHYALPNGLEVVLLPVSTREDVAVELWTHAGTRHEPTGKYGMAHFFEHVMPHGALLRAAAVASLADSLRTGSNARTRPDYTRYYQQTTRDGVGLFLLMAASRMSSNPRVDLSDERVETQRARVQAEMARWVHRRWGEPVGATLARGIFGADHPYGHDGYGTPEATDATTRDDLVRWQRAHVRPEYTTLFLAGGFEPGTVRPFIDVLFGRLEGGVRPPRELPRVPRAAGGRHTMEVAADTSLLFVAWPAPPWAHADAPLLDLFARVLEERLADRRPAGVHSASVEAVWRELAGSFAIVLTHAPGADASAIESWARTALAAARAHPSAAELEAALGAERDRIRSFREALGWIGGRIELVGESLVFADDPAFYLTRLERQRAADSAAVSRVAGRWLEVPPFVLAVEGTGAADD